MIGKTNVTDGAGLNFKVVGNPQPENPKANTIWVDTDVEITGWDFSAEEPANPFEGMVWFSTGAASPVAFNALKKNSVMVYPLSAKQYSGGAFVSKSAEIYQSGAWIDFITYLYNKGDLCTDLTGGWNTRGWRFQSGNGENVSTPVASYADTSVKITSTEQASYRETGIWETKNDIDLTGIDTISFHVLAVTCNEANAIIRLGAFNRNGSYAGSSFTAYTDITSSKKSAGYYTVDVSKLSGSHAIGVLLASYPNQISITLDEIKLYRE